MYEYYADVVRVIDGDTLILDIDLGLSIWVRGERCRMHGIDAPEMHTHTRTAGEAARDHLTELLDGPEPLMVRTYKDRTGKDRTGKYGRLIVDLIKGGMNVNNRMVVDGHAVEASY